MFHQIQMGDSAAIYVPVQGDAPARYVDDLRDVQYKANKWFCELMECVGRLTAPCDARRKDGAKYLWSCTVEQGIVWCWSADTRDEEGYKIEYGAAIQHTICAPSYLDFLYAINGINYRCESGYYKDTALQFAEWHGDFAFGRHRFYLTLGGALSKKTNQSSQ